MVSSPKLKKFLVDSARGAARILMKHYEKAHKIDKKPGAGIVTEADKESEAYLLKRINKDFPQASIITEESGEFKRDGDLCFVMDPLDGTSNYAHGFPMFCISIGVLENGKLRAGVIYHPVHKELFYAERNKGATLNGKKIRVSKTQSVDDMLVGTGFYYARGPELTEEVNIFRRVSEVALGVRRPGSAALDLAYVACGRYDGFWERGLSPWDVAAGYLLVEEAGGIVSDYRGKPTDIFRREGVTGNPVIHAKLIQLIQAN